MYLFTKRDFAYALVGSANFTNAGLRRNVEVCLLQRGSQDDAIISRLQLFFDHNWMKAVPADQYLLHEKERPVLEPRFNPGDEVYVVTNPSQRGVVVSLRSLMGTTYYRVFVGKDGRKEYPEEALAAVKEDTFLDRLQSSDVAGRDDLLRHVTYIKLTKQLTDNLYSLLATRTIFQPHQFKPLLRFLTSPAQRLLVADEVGLGKTIEAALIYAELKSRGPIERVLVVCPSILRTKWKRELQRRLDEDFAILDGSGVRNMLGGWSTWQTAFTFRYIVSMELLRDPVYIEQLQQLHVHFDLVIVDEAHHMRNPESDTHLLGEILSELSVGMIFLSATPLHLGSRTKIK